MLISLCHFCEDPEISMNAESQNQSGKDLDLLLKRIQRRRIYLKMLRSLEGALCGSLLIAAVLILVDKLYQPVTATDQKLWASGVAFLLYLLGSVFRYKSTTLSGAVEVEKNSHIPQTISTAIYARDGKLTEDTSKKVIADANEVSGSVDLKQALPVANLWPGKVLWTCATFFLVSLFVPAMDLLGTQAMVEEERKDSARALRKEKALVRRLEKVEEISKKHEVSKEVRDVIQKIADNQKKNLQAAKSPTAEKRTSADLQEQLNRQKSKVAAAKKSMKSDSSKESVNRLKEGLDSLSQQSSPEMRRLAKALQEEDPGQIATALDALAKKIGENPEAMKRMGDQLRKMMGRKPGRSGKPGESGSKDEDLVNDLEQLSRMLKDLAMLEQVKDQLEFTEAELSQLAQEWPEGDPPKICPDCLAGKCDANSGGT